MDELSQRAVALHRSSSRYRSDELGTLASVTVCTRQFNLVFGPAIAVDQLLGLLTLTVGFVIGSISIYKKWAGIALDGFTTVILLIVFASGVLMLSLGIIGHYLARIYEELKLRPHYVLKNIFPSQEKKE
ncbi:MAG: hypothetical protein PHG00_03185 [Methylococcales bacterium]|nr:hypothetical protein [Methylococcales bacterium]